LNQSTEIWKLAKDLGIRNVADPVSDIMAFCEKRIKELSKGSDCKLLSDFLLWIAGRLGTSFEEIHNDAELAEIKSKYVKKGEKVFVTLEGEFSDGVLGVTFRRSSRESWEPPFVSVIDCRGGNARKAYYTKWHELAHLLILTDQSRLCFQRTVHLSAKDPEEVMVDIIAGKFGFYDSFITPLIKGEISFEQIEILRQSLCPEASNQASLIGFVKSWPEPCMLLLCREGLKKSAMRQSVQGSFFNILPRPALRAVKVTVNDAARLKYFRIHENMRVPSRSIIHSVHACETDSAEAIEDLSWWETSDGLVLPEQKILVKARNVWGETQALIIPKFHFY
jgi:hypothetical protein